MRAKASSVAGQRLSREEQAEVTQIEASVRRLQELRAGQTAWGRRRRAEQEQQQVRLEAEQAARKRDFNQNDVSNFYRGTLAQQTEMEFRLQRTGYMRKKEVDEGKGRELEEKRVKL